MENEFGPHAKAPSGEEKLSTDFTDYADGSAGGHCSKFIFPSG
jgi:hypothetical protein